MSNKLNSILHTHGFGGQDLDKSLYIQLSNAIMRAILNKRLVKDDKLPPTRILAYDLGVSRSTVIKAYELLCFEKYIEPVQGSGYYVNDVQHKKLQHRLRTNVGRPVRPALSEKAKRFVKHVHLMNRGEHKGIAFRPGLPPLDVFPMRKWQQLTNNYWKEVTYSEMSYGDPLGLETLRKSIVDYLKIYRNIQCDYRQVVIVTGSLHSLSIVADVLIDEGDRVVLENPTYANALSLFKSLKTKIITAEVDSEGLNPKSIKKTAQEQPKLIYTTPSNQYPSGVQMSLNRRLELLEWAQKHNSLIVEDDYDHEFSNWESPVTSIFGLDQNNSVIYQGTFNKLLHPSIRLGYVIVPHYLIDPIRAIYEQSFRFVSPVTQKVMAGFIEKGYLNQHLREVVQISNDRREFFIDCFKDRFEEHMSLLPVNNGLHLIATLPSQYPDKALSDFLETKGLVAFPYSKYFFKGRKENGLVMGFSSVNKPIIKAKIQSLLSAVKRYTDTVGQAE